MWKAEKTLVEGTKQAQVELDKARIAFEKAQREGDLAEAARLQYGVIPELQKQLSKTKLLKKTKSQNSFVQK